MDETEGWASNVPGWSVIGAEKVLFHFVVSFAMKKMLLKMRGHDKWIQDPATGKHGSHVVCRVVQGLVDEFLGTAGSSLRVWRMYYSCVVAT